MTELTEIEHKRSPRSVKNVECPKCGGRHIRRSSRLSDSPGSWLNQNMRCRDCRHRFTRKRWWRVAFLAVSVLAATGLTVGGAFWFSREGRPGGTSASPVSRTILDDSAISKLQQQARLGDVKAQVELGIQLRDRFRTQDDKQAFEWFSKAAESGDLRAAYFQGLHYTEGRGVLQDYPRAQEILQSLADRGLAEAQELVGGFFRKGQGVNVDRARAYIWYNLATANGNKGSVQWRDMMGAQLNPLELAEAQRQTRALDLQLKAGKGSGDFSILVASKAMPNQGASSTATPTPISPTSDKKP